MILLSIARTAWHFFYWLHFDGETYWRGKCGRVTIFSLEPELWEL